VAKSTIVPGQNNTTSKIKAATLTRLEGSPAPGFVLWQSDTLPPKTVAQEELNIVAEIKMAKRSGLGDKILINKGFVKH
jgi:hypothetical protein